MTFKIFRAVTILIVFFWVESPRGLVGRSQRFGEACCLSLQGGRRMYPHGYSIQKNIIRSEMFSFPPTYL
jgi:hypothetical protein